MEIKIRKLKKTDTKSLDKLFQELIMYEKIFTNNICENIQITGDYASIIADNKSLILVAEDEKEIIGFLYIYEKQLDEVFLQKEAFIEAMYIRESYRKKGLGKLLINEAINWATKRKIVIIDIDVMSDNLKALNAYRKYGFQEIKKGMRLQI